MSGCVMGREMRGKGTHKLCSPCHSLPSLLHKFRYGIESSYSPSAIIYLQFCFKSIYTDKADFAFRSEFCLGPMGCSEQCKDLGSVLLRGGRLREGGYRAVNDLNHNGNTGVNEFLDLASSKGVHDVIFRYRVLSAFRRDNILNINNS
jgi:hypothetical protein